jgi:hypothetical protein
MPPNDWRMVTPCTTCPFNPTGPGRIIRTRLRQSRWRGILASLRKGEVFWCHKTAYRNGDAVDDLYVPTKHDRVCAGAIVWQEAHHCTSNYQRVAERLDALAAARKDP